MTEGFGTTQDGQEVQAVTLRAGELTARLLTFGAALLDLRLAGIDRSLTLGADDLAAYEGPMRYHGKIVGPVANRLSGAQAPIAGRMHRFEANQNGRHLLHSGAAGLHARVWAIRDLGAAHVVFGIDMADGEDGFPGNRTITARFELGAPATLRLDLRATTDAPTLMNLANHSYWTMDGAERWDGHRLRVAADRVLPTTDDYVPTGQIVAVAGTPFDFRAPREIAVGAPPLDHNFCLSMQDEPLREVLWLTGQSGVAMVMATTAPGLQVYDGRDARRPGRGTYEALAIEAQRWPDAPANPDFPSIELHPGEVFAQRTEWRFAAPPG